MTQKDQQQLGKTLWNIADDLRGAMNADDFRDYMLSFLFRIRLSKYIFYNFWKLLGSNSASLLTG
jgi:type I restriction enzyme M protein